MPKCVLRFTATEADAIGFCDPYRLVHGAVGDDEAHAVIAVHQPGDRRDLLDGDVRRGIDDAFADPARIDRDARDAMRGQAAQVRLD